MFSRFVLIAARRLFRNWVKYASAEAKADRKARKYAADILRVAALERIAVIEQDVVTATGGIVADGPFKGMKIDPQVSWGDGSVTPKLLGCYEQEIADCMNALRDTPFDAAINIGSAEGYYSIGAAMLLNTPRVVAIDIDPAALDATRRNGERNGVADKIECRGAVDTDGFKALLEEFPRSLVICDCEGYEVELITPETAATGAQAHFLIECHDFIGKPVTEDLAAVLSATHDVEIISEGARDPNRYEVLRGRDNLDRWLAMCEFRPETMRWVVARPRAAAS